MTPRKPYRYLNPKMVSQRHRCLAWILAARASAKCSLLAHRHGRRPQWLVKLEDTPAAIASQWGQAALFAVNLGMFAAIGAAFASAI